VREARAAVAAVFVFLFALTAAASFAQQEGYYVLDGFGGVHAGGGAPAVFPKTPYFGFDIAKDIVYVPRGSAGKDGILVLDGFGGVHAGGAIKGDSLAPNTPYFGFNIARGIATRSVGLDARIARVAFQPVGDTAPVQVILVMGGFRLRASCPFGAPIVEAYTTVNGSTLDSISVDSIGGATTRNDVADPNFNTGEFVNLIPDDTVNMVGSTRYVGGDGQFVIVEWHAYGRPGCDHFVGYAIG
jgi:hypothetical protein